MMTLKMRKNMKAMTKKEAVSTAVKFLGEIYKNDLKGVATLLNAEADFLEGGDKGVKTIVAALIDIEGFCNNLIKILDE